MCVCVCVVCECAFAHRIWIGRVHGAKTRPTLYLLLTFANTTTKLATMAIGKCQRKNRDRKKCICVRKDVQLPSGYLQFHIIISNIWFAGARNLCICLYVCVCVYVYVEKFFSVSFTQPRHRISRVRGRSKSCHSYSIHTIDVNKQNATASDTHYQFL